MALRLETSASNCPDLALPKRNLKKERSQKTGQWLRDRNACRRQVYFRDGKQCRVCGITIARLADAEIHEEPPRSLGGDATDPHDCVTLCPQCHRERHDGKLLLTYEDPQARANGALIVVRR